MRVRIKQSNLALSLAVLILTACGGGGNDVAGIGGSGYISTGTITSFGSVFVNGVEFETNASTFEIEDASGDQNGLRIGMVVQVKGTINADGITGDASHINYGDDLEGPVSNIVVGVDASIFTVFGKNVVVSNAYTAFEGVTLAQIVNGNVLEISGYYDQNGVMQASYVERKSLNSNSSTIFEIKGQISNLSNNAFEVQGVNIDASAANLNDLPDGLQNNLFVEVKGTFANDTINATEIEGEDSLSEDGEVELEGIITRYVSDSDFDVNDQKINASNAVFSPAGLMLEAGIKVEVEGSVSNGVLNASEIEIRSGETEVAAIVNAIDLANNKFTLDLLSGQLVVVQLTTTTRLEDDMGVDDNLLLSELNPGDFVDVQGIETATDTITATRVKRESEIKETSLQGIVTAESASDFTVLGVTYPVDGDTSYNNINEQPVDNSGFRLLTILDQTIIVIVDENADGFADSVEIED